MTEEPLSEQPRHDGEHGYEFVRHFLEEEGARWRPVTHPETFAAATEADVAGVEPARMAKTVLLHDHSGFWVAVIPASERLDLHKARATLGATSHLRLATEEEMADSFAVFDPGALPPFGLAAPEVVDRRLLGFPEVLCSGGDHEHSLLMSPEELVRVGHALIGDVCEAG